MMHFTSGTWGLPPCRGLSWGFPVSPSADGRFLEQAMRGVAVPQPLPPWQPVTYFPTVAPGPSVLRLPEPLWAAGCLAQHTSHRQHWWLMLAGLAVPSITCWGLWGTMGPPWQPSIPSPAPFCRDAARSGGGTTSLQHPSSQAGLRLKQAQILKLVSACVAIPWAAATAMGPRGAARCGEVFC